MDSSRHRIAFLSVILWLLASSAQLASGCTKAQPYYPKIAKCNLDRSLNIMKSNRNAKNFCISPFSVMSTLESLRYGCTGETKEDLYYALSERHGLQIPKQEWESTCDCYMSDMSSGGDLYDTFSFEQYFLLNRNQKLQSKYAQSLSTRFRYSCGYFEGILNGLLQGLSGLLGRILGNVRNLMGFVVKSSFYFDCGWKQAFDSRMTGPRNFYDIQGRGKQCQFMHATGNFKYKRFDKCSVLEIPYDQNDMSLVMYLPHERDGLGDLQESLTADFMNSCLDDLQEQRDISVAIPRMNLETAHDMSEYFKKDGLESVFDERNTDFSSMISSSSSGCSKVVHETTLSLTESGCSSRKSSSSRGSYRARGNPHFCADRPFVFSFVKRTREVKTHISVGCVHSIE